MITPSLIFGLLVSAIGSSLGCYFGAICTAPPAVTGGALPTALASALLVVAKVPAAAPPTAVDLDATVLTEPIGVVT